MPAKLELCTEPYLPRACHGESVSDSKCHVHCRCILLSIIVTSQLTVAIALSVCLLRRQFFAFQCFFRLKIQQVKIVKPSAEINQF